MKTGLVFGKFMPLHTGHLALINFALQHCDHLYIILCYTGKEPIDGMIRKQWLYKSFEKYSNITLVSFQYNDTELPNTSVSSRHVSELWARAFKSLVPHMTIVFTSEDYGDYLAEYMGIQHFIFDKSRSIIPVSANEIRANPFLYWNYISNEAKPWFVKKITLAGTESTGKSVLTERLAKHFNTSFVPEMAREIIEKTNECTPDDLYKIADIHAKAIQSKISTANKLLFADTDLIITKSYSQFLFGKELIAEPWVEEANKFDLYLFLEPDCEYIQDGTRLSISERNALSQHHKIYFEKMGIQVIAINGNWDERFRQAVDTIEQIFFNKKAATNK
jgi:HTH-type transcriptional regulator, transcriptional repressor of NAD biosynthesis genes